MTQSAPDTPKNPTEPKLPRRDWILLPMIYLMTICGVAGSTELIARRLFPLRKGVGSHCLVTNDRSTGVRAVPNSVCRSGVAESEPVEYRFNSCGFRTEQECGPKPPGTYRIVLVGSSFALGSGVQQDEAFGPLLAGELSRRTGRRIEVYNEGELWAVPRVISMHFPHALAAQPDLVLWTLTGWDVQNTSILLPEDYSPEPPPNAAAGNEHSTGTPGTNLVTLWRRAKAAMNFSSFRNTVKGFGQQTQTLIMIRHFLWESQSLFVKDSLRRGGQEGEFLQSQPSAHLQNSLQQFNGYVADVEQRTTAAGVPVAVAVVPLRAQAAIVSMGEWPAGIDPHKADNEIRSIIETHGGIYIDVLRDFRTIPNPEQYYLPIDGHLTVAGNALVARILADELTSGAVPALKVDSQARIAPEQSK